MKIRLKLRKFGGGYSFYVPKVIVDNLKMIEGDEVIIDVDSIIKSGDKSRNYKCKLCGYEFSSEEEFPYCVACSSEILEVVNDN
jgi:Zn finger protein HypA/HybF involved in hydrogenase expression